MSNLSSPDSERVVSKSTVSMVASRSAVVDAGGGEGVLTRLLKVAGAGVDDRSRTVRAGVLARDLEERDLDFLVEVDAVVVDVFLAFFLFFDWSPRRLGKGTDIVLLRATC